MAQLGGVKRKGNNVLASYGGLKNMDSKRRRFTHGSPQAGTPPSKDHVPPATGPEDMVPPSPRPVPCVL